MIQRRGFIQASVAFAASCALSPLALAQSTATTTLINGFPPGGIVDAVTRQFAHALSQQSQGNFIVENRVGAGGRIAATAAKLAAPDATTWLLSPDTIFSLYPLIYQDLSYDSFKDFQPVSTAVLTTDAIAVGPLVPESVTNLDTFLDWARANPESANFGSPGTGTPLHFLGALLARESGVELQHVAYRGAAPGINDLLGGQIAAMIAPTGNFLPLAEAGRVRILATSGKERTPFTPDVPTFLEQEKATEYPTEEQWFGFLMPAGTPDELVGAASQQIAQAAANEQLVEGLSKLGLKVQASTPEHARDSLKRQHETWASIIRQLNLQLDL